MTVSFLERCFLTWEFASWIACLLHMQEMLSTAQLGIWCKWDDAQWSWTMLLSFVIVSMRWAKEISRVLEWERFSHKCFQRSTCVGEGFPLSVGPSPSQPPDGKIRLLFWCHFMSPLHQRCKPSLPDKYGRRHMCNYRPNIALDALAVLVIWNFFFLSLVFGFR